jgi:hypothetical protein
MACLRGAEPVVSLEARRGAGRDTLGELDASRGSSMSAELIQHVLEHPPRCVAGFHVDPASPLLREMPESADVVRFALRCSCGSAAVRVLGCSTADETDHDKHIFLAPLALACSACGAVTEVFDPRRDGHDAEIGECWSMTGEGPRSEFRCSECGAVLMDVVVGFQYPIDDDDFESDEEVARHPQDFFTWFVLYGRCKACGALQEVANYECA